MAKRFLIIAFFLGISFNLFSQETEIDESAIPSGTKITVPQKGERVPSDSASALAMLKENLQTILTSPLLNNSSHGVVVYSIDQKKTIFEKNPVLPLTPASTTKLYPTFAALHYLGANHLMGSRLFTTADIVDGTVKGDVYFYGGGDGLLSLNDVEQIADQLYNQGIRRIAGNLIVDASIFDNLYDRMQYCRDSKDAQPMPPVSGLTMNRNLLTLIVSAGSNGVARAQSIPSSETIKLHFTGKQIASTDQNEEEEDEPVTTPKVKSRSTVASKIAGTKKYKKVKPTPLLKKQKKSPSKSKKRASLEISTSSDVALREFPDYGISQLFGDRIIVKGKGKTKKGTAKQKGKRKRKVAALPRLEVQSTIDANGYQSFVLQGSPGRNNTRSFTYEVKNPPMFVAGVLFKRLQANGIQIDGAVKQGKLPEDSKVLTGYERPLIDMIDVINKNSDNYLAEHCFKLVGNQIPNAQNSSIAANQTIKKLLDSLKISTEGITFQDGSGLCKMNKSTARSQAQLLAKAASMPFAGVFYQSLSVPGSDGTTRARMANTNCVNNLHAKTGTLNEASALSGYVRTRDGERLAFSFIFNGTKTWAYKAIENQLAIQLAEFSYKTGGVDANILK